MSPSSATLAPSARGRREPRQRPGVGSGADSRDVARARRGFGPGTRTGRSQMEVRDKIYIDGAWVPSTGKGTLEVFDSNTEEVIGTIPEGTAEDVEKAVAAAVSRLRGVVGQVPRGALEAAGPGLRGPRRPHRRDRRDDLQGSRHAAVALQDRPGRAADRRVRRHGRQDHRLRVGERGRQLADRPGAHRRGRGDHPLELPALPDRPEGGPGAGRRLHRGPEAERGGPAERVRAGRRPPRRRASRRACSTS